MWLILCVLFFLCIQYTAGRTHMRFKSHWNDVPKMIEPRDNPLVAMVPNGPGTIKTQREEILFSFGGMSKNSVEFLRFGKQDTIQHKGTYSWQNTVSMPRIHRFGGIANTQSYSNNQMIIVAGGSILDGDSKKVHRFDINKEKWWRLPNTLFHHWCDPYVWINEETQLVGIVGSLGDITFSDGNLGGMEFCDLRDRCKKWITVARKIQLYDTLGISQEMFQQKDWKVHRFL